MAKDHLLRRLCVDHHPQLAILHRGCHQIAQTNRAGADKGNVAAEQPLHFSSWQRARKHFPGRHHALGARRGVMHPQLACAVGWHGELADLDRIDAGTLPARHIAAAIAGLDHYGARLLGNAQGLQRERGHHRIAFAREQGGAADDAVSIAAKGQHAQPGGSIEDHRDRQYRVGILRQRFFWFAAGPCETRLGCRRNTVRIVGQEQAADYRLRDQHIG